MRRIAARLLAVALLGGTLVIGLGATDSPDSIATAGLPDLPTTPASHVPASSAPAHAAVEPSPGHSRAQGQAGRGTLPATPSPPITERAIPSMGALQRPQTDEDRDLE